MSSRGTSIGVTARNRKSLVFFWIALFITSIALQYAQLSAPKSVSAASGLLADTVQGFEIDGDLKSGNASTNPGSVPTALINNPPMANGDDWLQGPGNNGVASLPSTNTADTFLDTDAVDPGDTSAYVGGNKEDDTRDWGYVNAAGPNAKTDFKHIMAHAEVVGNSAFAYLGAERMVNNGTMVVDFELNKKPFKQFSTGPAKPDRSNGDLLISLEYSNGGTNPVVTIYRMANVVTTANGQTNDFVAVNDADTISAVRSATNFVDLTDSGFGYTVPSFDFAEASVDLSKIGVTTGCPGFSTGHIRSRTGGDPGSSQLKDAAPPFNIDLNNCGKVTIKKNAIPDSAQDFNFTTTGGAPLADFSLDDDNDNTLSDTKVFNQVPPGDYTVTEGATAGWKLTDLVCNDANGSVNVNTGKATLKVDPNEAITCTYTNTKLGKIIVEKQTIPDGASGSFTFTGDLAGSIGDGGTIVKDNLLPGDYTTTESDPTPPFDLGQIACDDNDSGGTVVSRTATYHLQAGETVKCVFTNVQRGTINIIKDAQPNSTQDFHFTTNGSGLSAFDLDDDNDPTLSNTKQFTNVVHGDYTVTETDINGWELTNLVCDGTLGSTGTRSGNTANIHLNAGGSVTCTYTNVKAGRILVDKVTNPSGDPQKFTFTPSYDGGSTFQLADQDPANDSGDLKPGKYNVAETVAAGWDLTGATCDNGDSPDDITLDPGETITCTFANTKRGHVIDKKVMVGGTSAFDFTGTPAGSISQNNGTISQEVKPGQYTSTEAAKAGWDLTGISCDDNNSTGTTGTATATFNVEPGETVTCTFTNVKRGHILVDKVTDPSGDPQKFTFTPSYNGDQTFQLADADPANDSGALVPGSYSVAETAVNGWDLTNATCSDGSPVTAISLQAGETVTCTFTNVKRGHIVIDKVTDPDGDPQEFTFDPSYGSNFNLADETAPNDSGALVPGTYTVEELALAGWDLTGLDCNDANSTTSVPSATATIHLEAGETVTCTFTNTKRGTIIVEKQTVPDGAQGSFTFTGDAAGSIGDGGQIVVSNLKPGQYSSTEADPGADFDLGAIVCNDNNSSGDVAKATATFNLEPGETVKCTFTNVQRGSITIIKDADPDSEQDFGFTTTGSGLSGFSLDDNGNNSDTLSNTKSFINLVAGDYSVSESDVDGWDLTKIDCEATGGSSAKIDGATANLTLNSGGSITCVYHNAKPSIEIVKTAGNAADGAEFVTVPGPVTYHYHVTNTGPVALNDVVVTDDNGTPGDASDDFTATCPKTTLAAGESMDCSATVQVTENRTNIGTATGTSGGGTNVEDADDAVVRVPTINIDKSADDHLVEPNQTVHYTIGVTIENGPVLDATVVDDLPAGQTYKAGTGEVDGSPSEPDVTNGGKTLTWHLGTLNDGDPAATIEYDVTIDADASTDAQTNEAELCVLLTEEGQKPLCDTDTETVTPQKPAIEIIKTAGDAADGEVFSTEPGNVEYTYKVTNTGPLDLHDVHVTDDNGTPGDTSDDFEAICPKDTLAVGESMTCTATVDVTVDTTNVAVAEGTSPEGNKVDDHDDAVVEILTHGLVIAKSNDAPLETLQLPDGTTADLPTADEGETVTFTLAYTFSGDPVTNGIITDVLPEGLTYVDGSATNSDEFTFVSYDDTTRTLTWTAANVTKSGSLSYEATVDKGASELPQPLENVATIKSDQTPPDSDTSDVFVPTIPKEETAPPTDVLAAPQGQSAPGSSLLLTLAVLGGIVLVIGLVTPVPAVVRRRKDR